LKNLRAETHKPEKRELLIVNALPRTDSPSSRSCPASGSASSFFLASALCCQQALRPTGGQDARRVQPTSATCLNDVYPYLVRSRLAAAAFTAWTSRGDLGSTRHDRGTRCFTTPENASADHHRTRAASILLFWSRGFERGRFLPTAPDAIEPLTPLSPLPLSRNVGVAFALRSPFRAFRREIAAKATVTNCS
jgi:hypothetical protein